MKFVHNAFEYPIEFEENIINVIVIENPQLFYEIVCDLDEQVKTGNGNFTVSENIKIVDISKTWSLVINPLDFEMYQKKIITKLHMQIKAKSESENFLIDTSSIKSALCTYFEKLFDTFTFPLVYIDTINIADLCKALEIKPVTDAESFLEKIVNFIDVANEFLGITTFVFVNLKSYCSESKIVDLYTAANYKKINILLIENTNHTLLAYEKKIIIDNDLCEI